ncbi:hypothetical protein [Streptomyces sp. NPDC003032]
MAPHYPRADGSPLPPWSQIPSQTRENLAEQVPDRLKRVMYPRARDTDAVPTADFTHHAIEADAHLAALLDAEPNARDYFGSWTFATVTDEPNPMRAAEAEYYLCDALIEYGARYCGHVWDDTFPVLAHTVRLTY